MKKISLATENAEEKLNEVLSEVQKRSTARNIKAKDIIEAIKKIENELNIPKKSLNGCKAYVDLHAQHFSSRYKWIPESTQFSAENHSGKWTITDIERKQCHNRTDKVNMVLSDTAKEALIKSKEQFYI